MNTPLRALICALLTAFAVAGSGCGTSPPVRYFTLAAEPPLAADASAATQTPYVIAVGPITVPEMVDRPHLVLRSSPTRVEVTEQARWAAPLKSEIPRVIASRLARLLPGATTATSDQRALSAPDYRVHIDIQRFDSAPGESATVGASWSVRTRDGARLDGRSVTSEQSGAGYDELVAAHSRALGSVAKDIAAAILKLRGM